MNKLKQALIKDFKNLYQKEYTGAWREARMIRSIEIGVMSLKNTEKFISSERQRLIEEVREKVIGKDEEISLEMATGKNGKEFTLIEMNRNKLRAEQRKELNKLKGINENY